MIPDRSDTDRPGNADDHTDLHFDTYFIALAKFSGNSGSFSLVFSPSQQF
jgi:hypothetical protein